MEFNPNNKVVKHCLKGISMEEKGESEEAAKIFLQAWNEANYDFEKFISAHYVAKYQQTITEKLKWLETALQFALNINDDSVKSAFPGLYSSIAKCYEELNNPGKAKKHVELATMFNEGPSDKGPFYHGTKADLRVGDLLTAGGNSNYKPGLKMNHIYFTAQISGAGLAAALATGEKRERIYIVEPTGRFEHDPNVTDKKFPGNPTRSYRSQSAIKIVGEVTGWERQTPEEIQKWREKLASNKDAIIN